MPAASGGDGGSPAPPTSSGSGIPTGSSPIPLAGGDYATAAATANAAYNQALASINQQRQSALQQFGYSGQIDPTTGQITNMAVDPNNPFGQYQQMLKQGADDQQGVQAAAMARGLGNVSGPRGGGLAAQGLDQAKYAFGENSANLGQALTSTLSGLTDQQNAAQTTENNALWNAELAATQQDISNGAFDTANTSGVSDQPANGGGYMGAQTTTAPTDAGTVKAPKANPFHKAVTRAAARTAARRSRRRR